MTRNGKIGRLPEALREQLNQRLAANESGTDLREWLNGLPEVQAVLARDFGGEAISEQNLSIWRTGGFQDWRRQQDRRAMVLDMARDAEELETDAGGVEVGEQWTAQLAADWSALITADLAMETREMLAAITDPAVRCARMQECLHTLAELRRQDYLSSRLELERERQAWERQTKEEGKQDLAALAKLFLGGGKGEKANI